MRMVDRPGYGVNPVGDTFDIETFSLQYLADEGRQTLIVVNDKYGKGGGLSVIRALILVGL